MEVKAWRGRTCGVPFTSCFDGCRSQGSGGMYEEDPKRFPVGIGTGRGVLGVLGEF